MIVEHWKKYRNIDGLSDKVFIEMLQEDKKNLSSETIDENWLTKYENQYFMGNKTNIKRLNQTSKWVEESITHILITSLWDEKDVLRILAWKIGKIIHSKSEENKKFIYAANWNEDDLVFQLPSGAIITGKNYLKDIIQLKQKYNCDNGLQIWRELVECTENNKVNGMGPVYLITLLSFISGGEYPIFDRFAMAALVAIKMKKLGIEVSFNENEESCKRTIIRGCGLSENSKKQNIDEIQIYYQYRMLLNELFGFDKKSIEEKRRIDRALWVYGHNFHVPV